MAGPESSTLFSVNDSGESSVGQTPSTSLPSTSNTANSSWRAPLQGDTPRIFKEDSNVSKTGQQTGRSAVSRRSFGPQMTVLPSPGQAREDVLTGVMRRRSNIQKPLKTLEDAILTPHTRTPRIPFVSVRSGGTVRTPVQYTPYGRTPTVQRHQLSFGQLDHSGFDRSSTAKPNDDGDPSITELPSAVNESTRATNMVTLSFAPEEHPASTVVRVLFDEFHLCLKSYSLTSEVLDLLQSYEKACHAAWKSLDKSSIKSSRQSFIDAQRSRTYEIGVVLREERNTWRLIHSLYQDLLSAPEEEDEIMETETPSYLAYSEKKIVENLYRRDSTVRLQQVVVDWLEKCAEESINNLFMSEFAADRVCWEKTLWDLKQPRLQGRVQEGPRPLVTEIDPDAPHRQGKHLVDEDEEDEADLIRNVYFFIRAGRLVEAQKLCDRAGQPWRAAALEGWKLWHNPNFFKLSSEDAESSDVKSDNRMLPVEGNPYREVWKSCAWALAEQTHYSQYERAVYASLSGNLEQVLPVCSSWTDYLWAHYKAMIDVRIEQEIWTFPRPDRLRESLPDAYWSQQSLTPEDIFERIEGFNTTEGEGDVIQKFRSVQKNIILHDMVSLAADFCMWLANSPKPSHHFLRFLAHLVLFFRSIGVGGDDSDSCSVLHHYVEGLIDEGQSQLVATYTASLPVDERVPVYAKFLEGITDVELKKECIQLAEKAGLDVREITKTVVDNIRNVEQEDFTLTGSYMATLETDTSETDKKKVAAIDWLMFEPSQRSDALLQANAVMRGFLAAGKLGAARDVFVKIPKDSVQVVHHQWQHQAGKETMPPVMTNAVKEYLCVKAYLDANDAFQDWFRLFHENAPVQPSRIPASATMQERVAFDQKQKKYDRDIDWWRRAVQEQSEITAQKIYDVVLFVNGGWMTDELEDDDENRSQQMFLLRQLCLPGMVFLLHQVLHSIGSYQECVQLADLVASEKYQLYRVFRRDELQQFLQLVRESSVKMLDGNVDPLGYDLV